MRTPEELKLLLRQIKNNNYQIPDNLDINIVITDMIRFIGHPNSELRDELIYSTFWKWSTTGVISSALMKNILSVCLDEHHLFYGIGERDSDSVFTRAFSVLIVPLALYMNQRNEFLSEAEVFDVKETVLRYVRQEKDFRGYVDGKGWAHAIAHTADALDDIARLGSIGEYDLLEILDAVELLAGNRECVYCREEDERIVTAFMAVYDRKIISDNDIRHWLNHFRTIKNIEELPYDYNLIINQKNFLRSLYFRFLVQENAEEIRKEITDILISSYGKYY